MRNLSLLFIAVLILVPAIAGAGAPVVGTYNSTAGDVLAGRATESMPADGAEGLVGNMVAAASWNGTTLGTNWKLTCPEVSEPPGLLYDGVFNGTGQRIYRTNYSGGQLWLAGDGAWAGGDPYYTSTLSTLTVIATKQYVNGTLTGVKSTINLVGPIDGYTDCVEMVISNAELVGYTPVGIFMSGITGDFPAFQGPSDCAATGEHGTYWTVHDVTLNLLGSCVVSAEQSTWGSVKSLYR
jgi:hypothetical protein